MSELIRMSGLASNMDTESIVQKLMSAQRMKSTKIQNKITKTEWKQDKWKTLNSKIYSFYTGALSKLKMEGNFQTVKTSSSNESKVTVSASGTVPEGNHQVIVESVANTQMVTGDIIQNVGYSTKLASSDPASPDPAIPGLLPFSAIGSSINITVGGVAKPSFVIGANSTVADFVNALKDAGLNASYDTTQKRFFISAKESGLKNSFAISSDAAGTVLKAFGLRNTKIDKAADNTTITGVSVIPTVPAPTDPEPNMLVVQPSDAKIKYNGAEYKGSSNTFTINGLTITAKSLSNGVLATPADSSDDEVININVSKDTDAIYKMVKDFVKSYNELLKGMNDNYYADPAKGYEPLTDAQKESMSDEQEKMWEDKIKNSLLRRDDIVGSITSSMRSTFAKTVPYEGKNYSLSSFGISSPDYLEYGILHIDGDSEDTLRATKDDKLKKAIIENPDAVMKTFTTMASELYKDLSDRMKSTDLRSALTVYNDKEMKKTIKDDKKELSALEKKLTDMETRYYKQFTAMEQAMQKMNSQSSSLSSMLGTSQ